MAYKCQDCGRIITDERFNRVREEEYDGKNPPCIECGGEFKKYNGPEEPEDNEDSEEEEEESEDDQETCDHCGKKIPDDEGWECQECGDNVCKACVVPLDDVDICKKCIDKAYPRRVEVKEVVREVIKPVRIEGENQISQARYSDMIEGKSKFD